ncbi:MAG: M23 family metallopeptidase [Parcubacteria group bacterium]|nr:M23 family metallopeptidase [Parcubacteria group bacterium]
MAIFISLITFITILSIKNSAGEGQKSIFSQLFEHYIEETALAATLPETKNQLADINSLSGFQSNLNSESEKEFQANTLQENSVLSLSAVLENPNFGGQRNVVIHYTVQPGDVLSFIASDFGISADSIIWANQLKDSDSLKPGQDLKIPPISGLLHEIKKNDTLDSISKKYGGDINKIIAFNGLPQDGSLQIGQELIIPDVKIPTNVQTSTLASNIPRFSRLPDLGSFFLIPTTGRNWGLIHGRNGVDIANRCGEPIYAAASGNIVGTKSSGWNGGAGKYIKINHSNNTETFYAHLSKILVEIGENVSRGQLIGLMGATGKSTGCHLHFEVHGAKNPLARI